MAGSGHQGLWTEPKYPGDAVRILSLKRGGELGDVRIQHYGKKVRVATFLPGNSVCSAGDTPKTEPERSVWCANNFIADEFFDTYVADAYADGWDNYDPENPRG